MSMSRWVLAGVAMTAFFTGACTSTFMVSKDGKGYMLGSNSTAIYQMLCESGDLKKILADTQLSRQLKTDLYRYNCSPERSRDKVKEIYVSMAPEERKELRIAFKSNGYDVNAMHC